MDTSDDEKPAIPGQWRPEPGHPNWKRYRGQARRGSPGSIAEDALDLALSIREMTSARAALIEAHELGEDVPKHLRSSAKREAIAKVALATRLADSVVIRRGGTTGDVEAAAGAPAAVPWWHKKKWTPLTHPEISDPISKSEAAWRIGVTHTAMAHFDYRLQPVRNDAGHRIYSRAVVDDFARHRQRNPNGLRGSRVTAAR